MAHIDYYLFTLSPYCYLAGDRLERIAEKHGASITYRPFALLKVFEATGTPPVAERHISRRLYRARDLERMSRALGMPLNVQPAHFPTNPVPSCAAVIAAQEAGGGDVGGLVRSLLRACWAEEKDVAEDAVIRQCLEENGFDPGLLDRAMLSGVETYERNTKMALDAHVFGAPSYVVGEELFWGQDRLDLLDAHLAELD